MPKKTWWLGSGSILWYPVINGNHFLLFASNVYIPNPFYNGTINPDPNSQESANDSIGTLGNLYLNEGSVLALSSGSNPSFFGAGVGGAPSNANQTSWQQKMRQASHFICGKSPGDRVAKSVLTGAGIGAVTGGIGGFVSGEVFGGEVTLGATGFLGAYLGAHVGAAVGAANGLTTGAVLAGICYAGFQYDN
jgi:hypothetical protein